MLIIKVVHRNFKYYSFNISKDSEEGFKSDVPHTQGDFVGIVVLILLLILAMLFNVVDLSLF